MADEDGRGEWEASRQRLVAESFPSFYASFPPSSICTVRSSQILSILPASSSITITEGRRTLAGLWVNNTIGPAMAEREKVTILADFSDARRAPKCLRISNAISSNRPSSAARTIPLLVVFCSFLQGASLGRVMYRLHSVPSFTYLLLLFSVRLKVPLSIARPILGRQKEEHFSGKSRAFCKEVYP